MSSGKPGEPQQVELVAGEVVVDPFDVSGWSSTGRRAAAPDWLDIDHSADPRLHDIVNCRTCNPHGRPDPTRRVTERNAGWYLVETGRDYETGEWYEVTIAGGFRTRLGAAWWRWRWSHPLARIVRGDDEYLFPR